MEKRGKEIDQILGDEFCCELCIALSNLTCFFVQRRLVDHMVIIDHGLDLVFYSGFPCWRLKVVCSTAQSCRKFIFNSLGIWAWAKQGILLSHVVMKVR